MNYTNKEQLIPFESITEIASKHIIKYVDNRFDPMYWMFGAIRGHRKIDYDEMPKIILQLMREQLFIVVPFILEDEKTSIMYEMMEKELNKLSKKLNKEYIEIHQIDIEEIRKDVSLTLCRSFRPASNMGVL